MKNDRMSIKKVAVAVMFFAVMLLPVSCGRNSDDGAIVSSNFTMDWARVNESIETADIAQYGYYMEKDYKTTEQEFNCVSLYNYDPDNFNAWKKTDYQFDISYGQNFKVNGSGMYDDATIVIGLLQTGGNGGYSAAYTPEGEFIEESGDWFMEDDKEEYLSKKLAQAREIFGITL